MRPRGPLAQNQEAEDQRKAGKMAPKLLDRQTTSHTCQQSEVKVLQARVWNPTWLGPRANTVPDIGQDLSASTNTLVNVDDT